MTVAVRVAALDRDTQSRCPACRAFLPLFSRHDEAVCVRCGAVWEYR
jgi:uncharacterized paraquat-inducible protein A